MGIPSGADRPYEGGPSYGEIWDIEARRKEASNSRSQYNPPPRRPGGGGSNSGKWLFFLFVIFLLGAFSVDKRNRKKNAPKKTPLPVIEAESLAPPVEKNPVSEAFTISCKLQDGTTKRLTVWVSAPAPGEKLLQSEKDRLWREHRAVMLPDVEESFQKLYDLALKNNVNYTELCVYALDAANKEKNSNDTK